MQHLAAQHVAQRAADRNGDVKPGQHLAAPLDGIHVGNDRRRHRTIRRFADADKHARGQHHANGWWPDPLAPLAALQSSTPMPTNIQREYRSASQPNSGAKHM